MHMRVHARALTVANGGGTVTERETWGEYVRRVTHNAPRKETAAAAGIDPTGISRWLSGKRPTAERAISFARRLREQPAEALVAAGYLEPHELAGSIAIHRSPSMMSDIELLAEIAERLGQRAVDSKDVGTLLARPEDVC